MKRVLLCFIVSLAFFGEVSAVKQDSVTMELRTKAYKRYLLVKDTTTIRTWMNMDRMNKALVEVAEYDNQLLNFYHYNDSVSKTNSQFNPDSLKSLQTEKSATHPGSNQESDRENLLLALAACGVLVIVLLVLLIMRSINLKQIRRTLDEREETFNSKIKRMEFLESEVKKMKNREKEIKAELEKGIIDYQGKLQQLRSRIDELVEENSRLGGLIETHQVKNSPEETVTPGATGSMKQELIDKLESMLARLRDMNA